MRQVQPVGPYAVVGFSYGGNLAVEVARRLLSENHAVELVAVLDAHAPGAVRTPPHVRKLARHLRIAMRLKRHEMVEYFASRIRRRLRPRSQVPRDAGPVPAIPESEVERRVAVTSERSQRAFLAYRPGPFPGRIVLVHATDLEDWMEVADPSGTCGWGTVCTGGVHIIPIDCRHLDLFKEPHLTALASHLDDLLDAIDDA
jgi:acetoacetyl-CoA synthetase